MRCLRRENLYVLRRNDCTGQRGGFLRDLRRENFSAGKEKDLPQRYNRGCFFDSFAPDLNDQILYRKLAKNLPGRKGKRAAEKATTKSVQIGRFFVCKGGACAV